nr:hypothetical protein [Prolinoborus fasciculus]
MTISTNEFSDYINEIDGIYANTERARIKQILDNIIRPLAKV